MPKIARPLTNVEVSRLMRPGWHAIGGVAGLLLQVRQPTGDSPYVSRSWILRLQIGQKRHPIGLGPYPQVSLSRAREMAREMVVEARQGINPLTRRRSEKSAQINYAAKQKTFQECAKAYIEAHASDYGNKKHRKQWASTLDAYVYPVIGRLLVDSHRWYRSLRQISSSVRWI